MQLCKQCKTMCFGAKIRKIGYRLLQNDVMEGMKIIRRNEHLIKHRKNVKKSKIL